MTQEEAQKVAEAFNEVIEYAQFKIQKVLSSMIDKPEPPKEEE